MKLILLILILAAAVSLWFWFSKRGTKSDKKQKKPVYVCPECGDLHCNCYLEKDENQSLRGKSDGQ